MNEIEKQIEKLINGKSIGAIHYDYTLKEQSQEFKAITGNDNHFASFTPVCKQSVVYIVAAVIFNEHDELLMIQEAKSKCAGTWYLPAGRVEPGENLTTAIKREVTEETGLTFEPLTLITVESSKSIWFRFTFTGKINGGSLKTVSQANEESLQASWIADINQLDLRSRDIIPLIDKTRNYWNQKSKWHQPILPVIHEHEKLALRLIMVIRKKENNRLQVLVCEKNSLHLPVCELNPHRSVHASLRRYIQSIFAHQMPTHKPNGLISVEHSGFPFKQNDGFCFTLLVSCASPCEESPPKESYFWFELTKDTEYILLEHLGLNKTLPLQVL